MNTSAADYSQALRTILEIEHTYTTDDLSTIIGVDPVSMQRKGVITRKDSNLLIILVTLQKRSDATPYNDHLDGSVLHWEGQTRGKHAERYMQAGTHEVFTFIRQQPRTPYTYYGRAVPLRFRIHPPGRPSQVELHLYEYEAILEQAHTYASDSVVAMTDTPYSPRLPLYTDKVRPTLIRTAQSSYRKEVLDLWGNKCSVTGVEETKVLIASHIKPWRESKLAERVDARNSLLLSPTYDKLFDLGLISFDSNDRRILLSDTLSDKTWDKLKVDDTDRLRMIPDGTAAYLAYHKSHIFNYTLANLREDELLTV